MMEKEPIRIDKLVRSEPQLKNWSAHTRAELNKMTSKQKTNLIIGLENFLLSIIFGYYSTLKAKLPRLKVIERRRLSLKRRKRSIFTPSKRKFSRKQLAAQRLFAKRARAGTLKRRRR